MVFDDEASFSSRYCKDSFFFCFFGIRDKQQFIRLLFKCVSVAFCDIVNTMHESKAASGIRAKKFLKKCRHLSFFFFFIIMEDGRGINEVNIPRVY